MTTYRFSDLSGATVIRDDGNSVSIFAWPIMEGSALALWEADGSPAPASYTPPATAAADYSTAIQAMLDAKARERGYDSIASAVSYVTSTVPAWAAEALVLRDWRDAVWSHALAELAAVQGGSGEAPSVEAFLDEISGACPFAWPE